MRQITTEDIRIVRENSARMAKSSGSPSIIDEIDSDVLMGSATEVGYNIAARATADGMLSDLDSIAKALSTVWMMGVQVGWRLREISGGDGDGVGSP